MSAHPNPNPEQTRREDQLKIDAVTNRKSWAADKLVAERFALGEPDDYKPCIARLPSGELLLTAFHQHQRDGNKVMEQTWLFRSPNGGRTWQSTRVESEQIKPTASNHTTRNVLELADGTLLLGVDYDGGGGPYFVWRSTDGGQTWDKSQKCEPKDFKSQYGFFGGDAAHQVDCSDLMRRMVKEELVKFDNTPLFPERKAYTVNYKLSDDEAALYESVTDYVKTEMGKADQLTGSRKGSVGFALTALQRRLASSPEAIYQSLRRRKERLESRLRELQRNQGG